MKVERQKVVASILKSNHFPIGMEMFSADNQEQWKQIKAAIDTSDYYILINKRRYGSLTKEKISYTEKEYNYAKSKGVPTLAFIVSDQAQLNIKDIETDSRKSKLLDKFIERVKDSDPCDFWINEDHLCTLIEQALQKQFIRNPQRGWSRDLDMPLSLYSNE